MADDDSPGDEPFNQNENEDNTWVLDSLVGFLKSPLWSSSLNDFSDRNSIVFDPDDIEDDEGQVRHRPEYENIFRQYRQMVDRLIGSHMTELGIDENQFAKACQMAEGMLASKLKRILFEELWAAENYEVFVRLMAKRNVELQLEALEMLVRKYGLVYDVFVPVGTSPKNFLSEEHVIREAIIRSLNDMELDEQEDDDDELENQLQKPKTSPSTIKQSNVDEDSKNDEENEESEKTDKETVQRDAARLVEVKQKIDQKMVEALQIALANEELEEPEESQPVEEKNESEDSTPKPPPSQTLLEIKSENNQRRVSMEEIHKRADYLRRQRDKILQQRQKDRTERISKYLIKAEKNPASTRPKTAAKENVEINKQGPDQQVLAFRKALAARLKSEVVLGGTLEQQK